MNKEIMTLYRLC